MGVNEPKKRKWYSLIDKIWAIANLEEAFKEVKRNGGAPGVDKVTIKTFESQLKDNLRALQTALRTKSYTPKPVRRVYIANGDGSQRPQMRSWRKPRKLLREMRRRGWKGELTSIRMTAWRNSKCKHAHYAMPNEWFKEIGL